MLQCDLKEKKRKYDLEYNKKNKEKRKKYRKEYYQLNKEKELAYQKEYNKKNKNILNERSKEYYQKHKEEIAKRCKKNRKLITAKEQLRQLIDPLFRKKRKIRTRHAYYRRKNKSICEKCRLKLAEECHHPNWNNIEEYENVCKECHLKIHGGLKLAAV